MSNNGFLESFNREIVSGWVRKSSEASNSEPIYLYVNNEFHSKISVSTHREDILGYGFGFSISTSYFKQGSDFLLSIRDSSGLDIENSPAEILVEKTSYDKVLFGKDGWLFLCNDGNKTIEQSTGDLLVSDDVINGWCDVIKSRSKFCQKLGAKYHHIIAPSKETVYHQFLPDGIQISKNRPVNRILAQLEGLSYNDAVIYPDYKDILEGGMFYHKGDTHWTYFGAYVAYLELMVRLKTIPSHKIIDYKSLRKMNFFQKSDLITKTTLSNVEVVEIPIIDDKNVREISDNSINNTGREQKYLNEDGYGKAIIYHSSSIDWMKPYLVNTFRECFFHWGHDINLKFVGDENPDFLISQTNERFLTRYPSDFKLII